MFVQERGQIRPARADERAVAPVTAAPVAAAERETLSLALS